MEGAIQGGGLRGRLRLVGAVIVVQCHGVFDMFHYGHLVHLQAARELGDCLIVTITADEFIDKGPGRPLAKEHQRAAILRALACVDEVRIIRASGSEPAIRAVRPHIYCKGKEYEGRLKEKALVESLGGRVVFTFDDEGSTIHTTTLLENYKNDKRLPRDSK